MDDAKRIAELEVAVRRGIAKIKQLAPQVMWDIEEGEYDQEHTRITIELMERALGEPPPPTERRKE